MWRTASTQTMSMGWKFGAGQEVQAIGPCFGLRMVKNSLWMDATCGFGTTQASEWANHAVALPNAWVSGAESCLELAFVNVGGYGNHIWLDNVNLDVASTVRPNAERAEVQLFPNPNTGQCVVLVPERLLGSHFQVRDNLGRMVAQGQLVDVRMEWAVQMPRACTH